MSYTVNRNEILCVVGESGSGKSVTAHAIMGLLPPEQLRVTQGQILYGGRDLVGLSASEWQGLRGRKFGMVFQEPMTALNPVMRVGRQVEEVLAWHTRLDTGARRQRVLDLFGQVLLPDQMCIRDRCCGVACGGRFAGRFCGAARCSRAAACARLSGGGPVRGSACGRACGWTWGGICPGPREGCLLYTSRCV